MKKIFVSIIAALSLCACAEFEPAFTNFDKNIPQLYKVWTDTEVTAAYGSLKTIADVAKLYNDHIGTLSAEQIASNTARALPIKTDIVVCGVVSTTDKPGNFYKSLYIQDETGGMEIKIGKNGLYNDYQQGQKIYVALNGLTVGMYGFKNSKSYGGNGMIQVGFTDASGDYETAYMENTLLVDSHVLRAAPDQIQVPSPKIITKSELPGKSDTQYSNHNIGKLVTLQGLEFAKKNFVLLYLDSNKDKKSYTNRVFLSDDTGTHGITTWAMSKAKMTEYLKAGLWDDAKVGSGNVYDSIPDPQNPSKKIVKTIGTCKGDGTYPGVEKAAYSVSQYFNMGTASIQVRTSGYCKFCDNEMPADVLGGTRKVDITGILTLYQGSYQLVVNSADDFKYNDTGEKIY